MDGGLAKGVLPRGEFLPPDAVVVSSEKLGCEVSFSLKFPL